MKKFLVNYSVDVNYDVVVEAKSEEEAEEMVNEGNFDDSGAVTSEEFLGVNNVMLLKENKKTRGVKS